MFKRATKSELKTWMIGDLVLFIILMFSSISAFGTFAENEEIGSLILGLVLMSIALLCVFFFIKMIKAFQTYDERMEIYAKEEEEEKIKKEQEEQERIKKEEEETKKFIEEYKKKVAEAEEQRRLEKEAKQVK